MRMVILEMYTFAPLMILRKGVGKNVPLTASDFRNFVTHRVINATEAAQLLGGSRY